jgi:Putative peptidoglycan binding domain
MIGRLQCQRSVGLFIFGVLKFFRMHRLSEIRKIRCSATCVLILMCASVTVYARQQATTDTSASNSTTKTPTHHTTKHSSHRKKSTRVRGQQKIDSERARTIQEALIREHYLSGEATGTWNQASEDAMRRYQEDNGWQTKEVPDSRALIKLGLGPSKNHLLNPESAMTTVPDAARSKSPVPASHTTAPVSSPPAQTPMQNDSSSPQ